MIEILNNVTKVLHTYFPKVTIYTDHQEANFKRPCFFVTIQRSSQRAEFFKHATRNSLFIIEFYPNDEKIGSALPQSEITQCVAMNEALDDMILDKPFSFLPIKPNGRVLDNQNKLVYMFNFQYRVVRTSTPEEDNNNIKMKILYKDVTEKDG